MRLWSIHPRYLDAKGLVALWREGLLAQKVLHNKTKGYKNHPQLIRFKETSDPVGAIADYLRAVANEADRRGYNFNATKIVDETFGGRLKVTMGQLDYEFQHLLRKLQKRSPELYVRLKAQKDIDAHPIFERVNGDVEAWEVT